VAERAPGLFVYRRKMSFPVDNSVPVRVALADETPRPERHLSKSGKEVSPMPDEEIERLRLALIHAHDERPSFRTRFMEALRARLNPEKKIVIRFEIKQKRNAA
jgi:hypothetical protein